MRTITILMTITVIGTVLVPSLSHAAEPSIANDTNIQLADISSPLLVDKALASADLSEATIDVFTKPTPINGKIAAKRDRYLEKYLKNADMSQLPSGTFTINASAYTASADECGNSKGVTASGLKVMEQRTIACPQDFPFGTKIAIQGYGTYVCEDRGGAIKNNHIDIYVQTKQEAFAFGRRHLLAEVVS